MLDQCETPNGKVFMSEELLWLYFVQLLKSPETEFKPLQHPMEGFPDSHHFFPFLPIHPSFSS